MLTIQNFIGENVDEFRVSLALTAHARAKQYAQVHRNPEKGKLVYLNTLAVYAVKTYLECMGFDIDLEASQSASLSQRVLINTADLVVQGYGTIECCPVLPGITSLEILPETWEDRIAFVAVDLDKTLREATILGFFPAVSTATMSLKQLQPMHKLLEHFNQLQLAESSCQTAVNPSVSDLSVSDLSVSDSSTSNPSTPNPSIFHSILRTTTALDIPSLTDLSQWVQGIGDASWDLAGIFVDIVHDAMNPPQLNVGVRSAAMDRPIPPEIYRSKVLTLGPSADASSITLLVGLVPLPSEEFEVWVQITPTERTTSEGNIKESNTDESFESFSFADRKSLRSPIQRGEKLLPANLQLWVLDGVGLEVMQATARSTQAIQLKFSAEPKEEFSLRIVLDGFTHTESFVL